MSALLDAVNLDLASTPNQPPPSAAAAAAPAPAPPPAHPAAIPSAQRARKVNGVQTDVLVQIFADRVLVIVTQLGRIGCMIQVTPPPSALPALPRAPPHPIAAANPAGSGPEQQKQQSGSILASLAPPDPSTLLTPLFGAAPSPRLAALHDLYAAQVAACVFRRFGADEAAGGAGGAPRPVVLGIGLKRTGDDGDAEGEARVSEAEKRTFESVMEMVLECLG
ncbi:hypothetical protein JCM3770_004870 [Rhodotorula araucariae]